METMKYGIIDGLKSLSGAENRLSSEIQSTVPGFGICSSKSACLKTPEMVKDLPKLSRKHM
jgi:hypothetical protein